MNNYDDLDFNCYIYFKDGEVGSGHCLSLSQINEWIRSYNPYDIDDIKIYLDLGD